MGGRPGRAGRLRFRFDPWLAGLLDLFTILSPVYTPANLSRHSRHATKGGGAMRISKIWLITSLLAVFVAGCGGGNTPYSGGGPAPVGDITPPTVRSTSPGDTATGVGTNSKLVANFSEVVNPATCTATTFTLARAGTPISGTVSCVGKTATFTPTGNLAPLSTHTATLTTGIKDLAGNALAASATWSFTTRAGTAGTAPTATSTEPAGTGTRAPASNKNTPTFT